MRVVRERDAGRVGRQITAAATASALVLEMVGDCLLDVAL
jgi:hypothetical protein